jgi:hypothetical protein
MAGNSIGKVEFRKPEFDPKNKDRRFVSASPDAIRKLALYCANNEVTEREAATEAILAFVQNGGKKK